VFSNTTLEELYFILSFSSLLQRVGEGILLPHLLIVIVVIFAIAVFALVIFLRFGQKDRYLYMWIDVAYLSLVILGSFLVAGKYIYAQDIIPIVVLLTLLIIRGQNRLGQSPELRDLFFGMTIALWVLMLSLELKSLPYQQTLVGRVNSIKDELSTTPAEETVLLGTPQHPITVRDASFYAQPLWDATDRLCTAVRLAQVKWPLPECDYLADLENNRPYKVIGKISSLASGDRLDKIKDYINRHYMKCRNYYLRLPDNAADCPPDGSFEGNSICCPSPEREDR